MNDMKGSVHSSPTYLHTTQKNKCEYLAVQSVLLSGQRPRILTQPKQRENNNYSMTITSRCPRLA